MPKVDPQTFWARVAQGEGCWEWQGNRNPDGYGCHGRHGRAHRTAWELTIGPIPAGLSVLHRCDNPPCCRPDHLFLGTHADNVADMVGEGRSATGDRNSMRRHPDARATGDRNGARRHPESRPRGERHGSAVLNEHQVRAISARHQEGIGTRRLAREFGVDRRTVQQLVKRETWSHIP